VLNVLFTVDVEIWCGGWERLDERFPRAFRQYVYGETPRGRYALPFTLRALADHDLRGVFFLEPLFATRFGLDPLAEVAGLLLEAKQDVQLHLHTEWVDEARVPIVPGMHRKQNFMRNFSLEDQIRLIGAGKELLRSAGIPTIHGFRAGSFGLNRDTLRALRASGVPSDSSLNSAIPGAIADLGISAVPWGPVLIDAVVEYPITVFEDRRGHLRPLQLGACSFAELRDVLWHAHDHGSDCVVILSHNFETMNQRRDRPDAVVAKRLTALCKFLDDHRDAFRTCGLNDFVPQLNDARLRAPRSRPASTMKRHVEQLWRRVYR
jgi:hypothetical protein